MGQVKRSEGYDRASKLTLPTLGRVNSRSNREALTRSSVGGCKWQVTLWVSPDVPSDDSVGDKLVDFSWVDKFNGDTWVSVAWDGEIHDQ
jgi:hypothetical protein